MKVPLFLLILSAVPLTTIGLPSGFIAEVVTDVNAVSGTFAQNPKNGDTLLLLVSKNGKVNAIEDPDNGSSKAIVILDLKDKMCTNNERGLQTITVHPNFEDNRYVYLFYNKFKEGCFANSTEPESAHPWNVVTRFAIDPETLMIDYDKRQEIWRGAPLHDGVHNGGAMTFGNDGKLYIATGDSGTQNNAQDFSTVHGKLIRLNDDGSTPNDNRKYTVHVATFSLSSSLTMTPLFLPRYSLAFTTENGYNAYRCSRTEGKVPVQNYTSDSVCSEIYAIGLRNPFRISRDPNEKEKTRFSIHDVGASVYEELSYGGSDWAGANYGWKHYEGPCLRHSNQECPIPEDPKLVEPFHYYLHRKDNDGCVSGAAFVPEGVWPEKYKFLFADFIWYQVYNLIEDPENECRTCIPPISRFKNETFFETTRYPGEGKNEARIVDMFFAPYNETKALYIVKYGNHDTVIRIRYTGIYDEPPHANFTVSKHIVDLNEEIHLDGTWSNDPEGEEISFKWFFGDGGRSTEEKPTHRYQEYGEYKVTLFVTDIFNQVQQKSMTITVGNPPNASILSPTEGDEFYVGQVLHLKGNAIHLNGTAFEDSELKWEVRKHHDDHYHPFLGTTSGNNFDLHPAPEPEDFYASSNSYLEIILYATDDYGLTTKVSRTVQPELVSVGINTSPSGLKIRVDDVSTSGKIVSWKNHNLHLIAENDPYFQFMSWSDGVIEKNRSIALQRSDPVFQANYCAANNAPCYSDGILCCSGFCHRDANLLLQNSTVQMHQKVSKTGMICVEEVPLTDKPANVPTISPIRLASSPRPSVGPDFESNKTDEDFLIEKKSPVGNLSSHIIKDGAGKKSIKVVYEAKESGSCGFAAMNSMIPVSLTVSALSYFALISIL
jgi:glucose/arabinose dehydrogenase